MHEAEKAKLLDKDNWKNYPGACMQNARHRAGATRSRSHRGIFLGMSRVIAG